jgi:hypothetical protein
MMLYCSEKCPCVNTDCDLYKNCDACVKRHHSLKKYPMTACEICEKEGYAKADPVQYFNEKRKTERSLK